ncbi:MAG: tetratricopeptide repeat protein [Calothrix sp. MO_167.B12]|nr:tetratricopeptide repeat protein [Calothrix sp. MO_167.B12]
MDAVPLRLIHTWYNKALGYVLQNKLDKGIEHLEKVIKLNPECREMAKTDSYFGIAEFRYEFISRKDAKTQRVVVQSIEKCKIILPFSNAHILITSVMMGGFKH